MRTAPRLSTRSTKILTSALAAYWISSLVSMATMSIGVAVFLTAFFGTALESGGLCGVASSWRQAWSSPWARWYGILSATLIVALAASLIGAIIAPLGFGGQSIEVHFLRDMTKVWYLVIPPLIAQALGSIGPEGRKTCIKFWLIALGLLSCLGCYQFFTGWPRPQRIPSNADFFHVTLFLGHHLSVASIFIFPFFAAIDLLFKDVKAETGLARSWVVTIVVFTAIALFFTYSRTLWIALPVGIAILLLWTLPLKRSLPILGAVGLAALASLRTAFIQNRLHEMVGVSERTKLWETNLLFFRLRPWTGTGWHHNLELSGYYLRSAFPDQPWLMVGHAHNNLIEMLGATGTFGTLSWLAFTAWTFGVLWPLARGKNRMLTGTGIKAENFARGLFCAWIAFEINGLTQVNFWESKVIHSMMIAIGIALDWRARLWQESQSTHE